MDLVADLRAARSGWPSRRAIDLTEDASILTAIANDVGVDEIFQRQVIAYGREGDALVVLSTSGNSREPDRRPWPRRGGASWSPSPSSATTAAGSPPRGSPTT